MANVKFYRLGKEQPVDISVYNWYKEGDASDGGIIFARVKDPSGGSKILQYIWANGIEYNVGEGSSSNNVHIDVSTVTPEDAGLTPSHGDYYIREEKITDKLDAEPRRTAYIFDSTIENGKWVVLDGNVDATNVFFKDGINRNASIGVLPATKDGSITNEGKAYNLKELLEYYLVGEVFPEPKITNGSANTPLYSISLEKPNALSSYMSSTTALVEVDTQITFNGINLNENASHTGNPDYTSSKSEITGMTFGAATNVGGEIDPNLINVSAGPIITSADYDDNFNEATATIKLTNNNGFTGINGETQSVIVNNNNLSLQSATGTIVEGENKLTLDWSSTAKVIRTITKDQTIDAMDYYYASNKGNTSSNKNAHTDQVIWNDDYPIATISNSTSSITITGVYPIYTNGGRIDSTPNNIKEEDGEFTTNTISGIKCIKYNTLFNYTSATTTTPKNLVVYIRFGNVENSNRIIYIPANSNYNVSLVEAMGFNGVSKQHDEPLTDKWHVDENVVTINGQSYKSIKETYDDGPNGKKELKITLSYKKK